MRSRRLVFAFALILPGIMASFACGLDETPLTGLPTSKTSDAAAVDGTIGADGSSGGDANGGDGGGRVEGGGPDGSITPPTLVYANTQTDLYSFDVDSRTLTHVAQLDAQCGDNMNDIAIDSNGQIYIFESTDAIYELATDGGCSGQNVLSMMNGDDLRISGRNAGTPTIVAIDTSHEDYYSIDPASASKATVTKITNNLFVGSPKFDVACAQSGTCWTALDQSHCSAGSAGSCLYSFAADGSGAPTLLGAINVHPNGLAYAKGSLYGFDDDGAIAKISIGPGPVASIFTPAMITLAGGTTQPTTWNGAASTSAYP